MKNEAFKNLKTEVIVKLHLLVGCCRTKAISKAQIEKSIQAFIEKVEKMEPGQGATNDGN